MREQEERLNKKMEELEREGPRTGGAGPNPGRRRCKCMVVVDSNGRGATAETIKSHIPKEERDNYEIEVKVASPTRLKRSTRRSTALSTPGTLGGPSSYWTLSQPQEAPKRGKQTLPWSLSTESLWFENPFIQQGRKKWSPARSNP